MDPNPEGDINACCISNLKPPRCLSKCYSSFKIETTPERNSNTIKSLQSCGILFDQQTLSPAPLTRSNFNLAPPKFEDEGEPTSSLSVLPYNKLRLSNIYSPLDGTSDDLFSEISDSPQLQDDFLLKSVDCFSFPSLENKDVSYELKNEILKSLKGENNSHYQGDYSFLTSPPLLPLGIHEIDTNINHFYKSKIPMPVPKNFSRNQSPKPRESPRVPFSAALSMESCSGQKANSRNAESNHSCITVNSALSSATPRSPLSANMCPKISTCRKSLAPAIPKPKSVSSFALCSTSPQVIDHQSWLLSSIPSERYSSNYGTRGFGLRDSTKISTGASSLAFSSSEGESRSAQRKWTSEKAERPRRNTSDGKNREKKQTNWKNVKMSKAQAFEVKNDAETQKVDATKIDCNSPNAFDSAPHNVDKRLHIEGDTESEQENHYGDLMSTLDGLSNARSLKVTRLRKTPNCISNILVDSYTQTKSQPSNNDAPPQPQEQALKSCLKAKQTTSKTKLETANTEDRLTQQRVKKEALYKSYRQESAPVKEAATNHGKKQQGKLEKQVKRVKKKKPKVAKEFTDRTSANRSETNLQDRPDLCLISTHTRTAENNACTNIAISPALDSDNIDTASPVFDTLTGSEYDYCKKKTQKNLQTSCKTLVTSKINLRNGTNLIEDSVKPKRSVFLADQKDQVKRETRSPSKKKKKLVSTLASQALKRSEKSNGNVPVNNLKENQRISPGRKTFPKLTSSRVKSLKEANSSMPGKRDHISEVEFNKDSVAALDKKKSSAHKKRSSSVKKPKEKSLSQSSKKVKIDVDDKIANTDFTAKEKDRITARKSERSSSSQKKFLNLTQDFKRNVSPPTFSNAKKSADFEKKQETDDKVCVRSLSKNIPEAKHSRIKIYPADAGHCAVPCMPKRHSSTPPQSEEKRILCEENDIVTFDAQEPSTNSLLSNAQKPHSTSTETAQNATSKIFSHSSGAKICMKSKSSNRGHSLDSNTWMQRRDERPESTSTFSNEASFDNGFDALRKSTSSAVSLLKMTDCTSSQEARQDLAGGDQGVSSGGFSSSFTSVKSMTNLKLDEFKAIWHGQNPKKVSAMSTSRVYISSNSYIIPIRNLAWNSSSDRPSFAEAPEKEPEPNSRHIELGLIFVMLFIQIILHYFVSSQ
ncbi:uncharacterized protein LOC106070559 [Biomphalaria glabrata]|uniref:Uncharacterized protein LOC106070559 n=1 Tax=Biomphalaria glabrata TaxID=6526 RepID=A0A9W2ZEN4_BIOGL|nr:uncharacterized protein LOC106070559 [Biomphalaria glabrata]XP_055873413.1 uncharacterized protein LOC106070559 [Biomphalaria glabrata]